MPSTPPGGEPAPIADALVVTLCASVSLQTWQSCGILEREWSLYRALAHRYRRIVLVTEGGPPDHQIARGLHAACPVEVVANDRGLERPAFATDVPKRVRAVLGETRSAVVKTDQMWGGELAVAIAADLRSQGIRVGLIARGGYPWSRFVAWEQGAASAVAAEAAAAEGGLCRAADLVVGTTTRMLDDLQWRYGIDREHTMLVPNFVPDAARPDESIVREPGTVLFAGRLAPQKRVERLIDAVALAPSLAREALPAGVRLTVIGDGAMEGELRARARERGIDAEFLPRMPQAELLGRMRRCAVYAQVSAYEGHPKTVLEAMACGSPVVVGSAWDLADVVTAGVTGLVTRCKTEEFAQGIARVLSDHDLAASLGRQAAADCRELRLDNVAAAEMQAHEAAIARAGEGATPTPGAVRWGPELLDAEPEDAAAAWARSLHGYARRLPPDRRARFCATLDTPVYEVIDHTALQTGAGIHPKHHLMRYHDFFVERIEPGERVLDLGCGYGAVARTIAERAGAHVTGMDFSKANLDQARAMIEREGLADRLALVEGDITRERARGPAGEQHFDVVVLSNVLEHLADRERLLAGYAEWYSPRTILIRVPAFDRNWLTAWKHELGVDHRCDPTHETEYTESSLRAELAAAGLEVEEMIVRWGEYWVKTGAPR